MRRCSAPLLGLALVLLWPARAAQACGVSVDGVWSCSLAEHDEELRPRWHLGAAFLYTSTTLRFGEGLRTPQKRAALVASASYAPTRTLSIQLSAGATLAGTLRAPDGEHDITPGPTLALGVSYRLIDGPPFVNLTGTLAGSYARTERAGRDAQSYSAFDLRVGVVAGWTLWQMFSPYAVARAFGGPVFWRYAGRDQTGTDSSHVQLGAGFALLLAERIDLFAEGIPLGEQALSGGVAAVF